MLSLAFAIVVPAFFERPLHRRNLCTICVGTCVVPLKNLSKVPLNDSNGNVDVAHSGPQLRTPAAKYINKCTLKEALAAPYSFSKLSTNFPRASHFNGILKKSVYRQNKQKNIPILLFPNAIQNRQCIKQQK